MTRSVEQNCPEEGGIERERKSESVGGRREGERVRAWEGGREGGRESESVGGRESE